MITNGLQKASPARLARIAFFFGVAWLFFQSGLTVAQEQSDASNLGDQANGNARRIDGQSSTPLLDEKDDVAIFAAWKKTISNTHKEGDRPPESELAWFIGFLEGRIRVTVPVWWKEILTTGRRGDQIQFGFQRKDYWPYEGSPPRVLKGMQIETLPGGLVQIKTGDQTIKVGKDKLSGLNGSRTDSIICTASGKHAYIGLPNDWPIAYKILKKEIAKNELVWESEIEAGGQVVDHSGRNFHFVEIIVDEQRDEIFVFGASSGIMYVEKLSTDNGKKLMVFSTCKKD